MRWKHLMFGTLVCTTFFAGRPSFASSFSSTEALRAEGAEHTFEASRLLLNRHTPGEEGRNDVPSSFPELLNPNNPSNAGSPERLALGLVAMAEEHFPSLNDPDTTLSETAATTPEPASLLLLGSGLSGLSILLMRRRALQEQTIKGGAE